MCSKKIIILVICLFFPLCSWSEDLQSKKSIVGLVIHGGAGTINRSKLSPETEKQIREKLEEALIKGIIMLKNGENGLDVVETVINILEDSPLFNAGKGAVFAANGHNEMDASIMDGNTLNAGAVTGVSHIKNPISLARKVMEHSRHVMLSGKGAEEFAISQGMNLVDNDYFFTEKRYKQLKDAQKKESENKTDKFGTVGTVVLDSSGSLYAGTSTGGMTNKKFGRIGDSPVIGAGTYANNKTCAVSCTGHGEYFIRSVVAYDISALMEYKGFTLKKAADEVINTKLKTLGGYGGLIAIDSQGNYSMTFNTEGMYRGVLLSDGTKEIHIFNNQ